MQNKIILCVAQTVLSSSSSFSSSARSATQTSKTEDDQICLFFRRHLAHGYTDLTKSTATVTVSKFSKESTALAFVTLSFSFISRLYFVRHSVMTIVATENEIIQFQIQRNLILMRHSKIP